MAATKTKREKALAIVQKMVADKAEVHQIVARIEKTCDLNTAAARTYYYWAIEQAKTLRKSAGRKSASQKKAA